LSLVANPLSLNLNLNLNLSSHASPLTTHHSCLCLNLSHNNLYRHAREKISGLLGKI
jgi:hypothetical protein